jgi:hypothetical protein
VSDQEFDDEEPAPVPAPRARRGGGKPAPAPKPAPAAAIPKTTVAPPPAAKECVACSNNAFPGDPSGFCVFLNQWVKNKPNLFACVNGAYFNQTPEQVHDKLVAVRKARDEAQAAALKEP